MTLNTAPAAAPVAAPSPQLGDLASRAMLCELSIRQWSARKLDRKATAKTCSDADAADNAARVNKYLLAGQDSLLKAIQTIVSAARQTVLTLTLPWSRGQSILAIDIRKMLDGKMEQHRAEFAAAVLDFVADYSMARDRAEAALGDLFDPADFPHPAAVAAKFGFDFEIFPMPAANDFRASMTDADAQDMRARIEASVGRRMAEANADAMSRLQGALSHLATTLRRYDAGDAKKLYDSVLGNAQEIAGLLPALNVSGDNRIAVAAAATVAALSGITTESLKTSGDVRKSTIAAAETLLRGIGAPVALAPATAPLPAPVAPVVAATPAPVAPVVAAPDPAPVAAPDPAPVRRRPLFAAPTTASF